MFVVANIKRKNEKNNIKTKKIIAAHQYILQGMNKTKVAEMFGFDEYSTFYRAYLKIMNNNN